MTSSLLILIVGLFVAVRVATALTRRNANPNRYGGDTAGNASPIAIEVNPAFNRGNTSPLAVLKRFQSGISYSEFRTSNQNNPQGGSK